MITKKQAKSHVLSVFKTRKVASAVRASLTPDLLKEPWRSHALWSGTNPMYGHCYVATEACYHLLGGARSGWRPMFVRHEGHPHWYLVGPRGQVLDITAAQFRTPVPYDRGRGKGFQTLHPSKRGRVVIERAKYLLAHR